MKNKSIVNALIDLNMSQTDLAKAVQFNGATLKTKTTWISQIVNRVRNPTVTEIREIAEVLNRPEGELF